MLGLLSIEKMSLMLLRADFSIGMLNQMAARRPLLGRLSIWAARKVQIHLKSICFNGWLFLLYHLDGMDSPDGGGAAWGSGSCCRQ